MRLWCFALLAVMGCDDDHATHGSTSTASGSTGSGVGEVCAGAEMRSGEATYYDFADGSGNCGFPATPNDLMVGAMNQTDYAGSAACGTCARVVGPMGQVDVRIVDRCPECPAGNIDLSPEAFALIAELSAGRVAIDWQYIECPVSGPIVYHFKDGSNQWWTALQIRNHRHAITSVAFQNAEGAFVEVPRLDYNYFVQESGMGPGPYTLRVTDVQGETLDDTGIAHVENGDVAGAAQFPACDQP